MGMEPIPWARIIRDDEPQTFAISSTTMQKEVRSPSVSTIFLGNENGKKPLFSKGFEKVLRKLTRCIDFRSPGLNALGGFDGHLPEQLPLFVDILHKISSRDNRRDIPPNRLNRSIKSLSKKYKTGRDEVQKLKKYLTL